MFGDAPAVGEDLIAQMKTCANESCLQLTTPSVMARLKTRVNPEIPNALLSGGSLTVLVKATIDDQQFTITQLQMYIAS